MNWKYWHYRYWHYWIGLFLLVAFVPICQRLHLPVRFDWKSLAIAYWLVLAAQSIFVAVLLCLIGLPARLSIKPVLERYRYEPLRILLLLFYWAALWWAFGWLKALVLSVDAVAVLELHDRMGAQRFRKDIAALFLPAFYLFAGFLLVLAYNCIIVSVRFGFAYDPFFSRLDKWMLRRGSVPALSHWAIQTFPLSLFRFLEFIYFGMFLQIGAAIILVSIHDGWKAGMQFVGTILTAYYLALALFYLFPSQGPYYLDPAHLSSFPASLQAYSIQQYLIKHALALWNHVPIHRISTDYFIAFPCMHIAQPLIVMWFLRRWQRMAIVLSAYDILLIVSILFLEWHYFVDILGGVLVAGVAIAITSRAARPNRGARSNSPLPLHKGKLAIE